MGDESEQGRMGDRRRELGSDAEVPCPGDLEKGETI